MESAFVSWSPDEIQKIIKRWRDTTSKSLKNPGIS